MTLQECYDKIGGDLNDVSNRFLKESLVDKFIVKFGDDPSYMQLEEAMEKGDYELAFRASHTLKGVCQNLSLTTLCQSSTDICELLRAGNNAEAVELLPKVREDYKLTLDGINEYAASRDQD